MKSIIVRTDLNKDKMILSYDEHHASVTVGEQRFEFDLESLWDLAKAAILKSTLYTSGMERRKLEASLGHGIFSYEKGEQE